MQLEEPGPGIGRDHAFRLIHRPLRRKVAPGIRAKVIAAKDNLPLGAALLPRQIVHPRHKIGGRHAGITAPMVDLVAGRLDQHGRARLAPVAKGGAQHDRMGGTDRGDAPWRSGPEKWGEIGQRQRHHTLRPVSAMKRSSSARVPAPSIGPRTVTFRAPAALA